MNKLTIGTLLVSAATALSACANTQAKTEAVSAAAATKASTVYVCQNNTCKGHADCSGFGNDSCAGNNECKGHGVLKAKTAAECTKKAGLWVTKK